MAKNRDPQQCIPQPKPMTHERAKVIQSKTAKNTGTVTPQDFAARATRAAANNAVAAGARPLVRK
jgi:hypothetical protein